MKKIVKLGILIAVLPAFVLSNFSVQASPLFQTTPVPSAEAPKDQVSLSALGLTQGLFLQAPLAHTVFQFNLPPEWSLTPGAVLHINSTVLISNFVVGQEPTRLENINSGKLTVSLNGLMLGQEFLQGGGSRTVDLQIPPEALTPNNFDVGNELAIEWDATISCDQNIAASLSISPDSFFTLPHEEVKVPLDLGEYPSPFFLQNNPFAAPVVLVVPDTAATPTLQSVIQIATSFGRVSRGELNFQVISETDLTQSRYAQMNLILIGPADSFALARQVSIPSSPNPGDGILKLSTSPWNPSRVMLLVTGSDDQAVLKAASALSRKQVVTANSEDTAFVSNIADLVPKEFDQDQTFARLGVGTLTFNSFGSSKQEIRFNIPAGQSIGVDAYLDLTMNHSQLIDYLRSGIVARINGITVGSIRLSDTSANLNTVRLIIPASAIKPGVNRLELQVDITPRSACSDARQGSLYVTILPDSFLHLPVTETPIINTAKVDLGAFPSSFTHQDLESTTFILPPDDPASWTSAGLLAYELGAAEIGETFPHVVLFSAGQTLDFSEGNMIVVGQPGRAAAVAQLANALPLPFDSTGLLTTDAQTRLSYEMDPARSIGYLETSHAPGQQDATILLVAGNNSQGLGWATGALTNTALTRKMRGDNFAVIQSSEDVRSDQYFPPAKTTPQLIAIPGTTTIPGDLQGSAQTLPPRTDLWWSVPLLVFTILGIIGLIILEFLSWKNRIKSKIKSTS